MSFHHLKFIALTTALTLSFVLPWHGTASALVVPTMPADTNVDAKAQKRAEVAYGKAYGAFENGDMEGALKHADRAFTALPNASTALIRAVILSGMERYQDAFEAYLVAADLSPVPEELDHIDKGLAAAGSAMNPAMGWVSFKTTPVGAKVALGEGSFKAPRTVGLPAGQHYFNISSPGHVGTSGNVIVNPGRGSNLSFALATERRQEAVVQTAPSPVNTTPQPAATTTAPAATATKKVEKDNTLAYTLMGVGGGAILAGAASYAAAVAAIDEANATDNEDIYNTKVDEANVNNAVAIGLFLVGAGSLGYGVWEMMSDPEGTSTAQLKATAVPIYGGGAFVLSGSF